MLQEMKAEHSPGTGKYSPGLQDSGKTNGVVVSILGAVVVLDSSRTNSSGTVKKEKGIYFAVKSGKFATIMYEHKNIPDLVPQETWFGQSHLPLPLFHSNP